MMMKNSNKNKCRSFSIIFYLILIGALTATFAQSSIKPNHDKSFTELIYVEMDPFAYINKGYSLHLGYENWGWRIDLTKVKVDFPESFEDAFYSTKAFDLVSNINGFKLDYIGNRSDWTRGAFIGLDVNAQKLEFTHRETQSKKDLSTLNLGIRAGYKFNIWKGFYVTPWAAVWKNVNGQENFAVDTDVITTNKWDWITTLHVGYSVTL